MCDENVFKRSISEETKSEEAKSEEAKSEEAKSEEANQQKNFTTRTSTEERKRNTYGLIFSMNVGIAPPTCLSLPTPWLFSGIASGQNRLFLPLP